MAKQSWRGTWWAADEPTAGCQGTLYYSDEGELRLELIGGFDTEVRTPLPGGNGYSVGMESRDFAIIHGVSGSQAFTLLGNHATHTSGGFTRRNIVMQDWSSNRALRGIHLLDPEERVFTRGHLQLERLLPWTRRSTLDLAIVVEDGRPTGEERVGRHDEPTVSATFRDLRIGLRVRSASFDFRDQPIANRRSLESVEWATLDFDPAEPVSYNALDTIAKDLQDLLTLCAHAPCGSHGQSLIYETSDAHPGSVHFVNEVEVMGRQIYRTEAPEREKPHHRYLFTLGEVDFPELVPRWLALKDAARMGFSILFGLRYISTGYVGTRLLGVASAAESIHAALRSTSTPLPKAQFRELRRKLLAAVADEPDAVREFVTNDLRNSPTYHARMLELASIPDPGVVERLLTDRTRWATMLKNARNDMAHANERSSQDPDSTPAYWLLEVTYALLCLVIMAELAGVSCLAD